METNHKIRVLVKGIQDIIAPPYDVYAIGLTDDSNKYFSYSNKSKVVFMNYRDEQANVTAYNFLTANGMVALPTIGEIAKYLYLYRLDGKEMPKLF